MVSRNDIALNIIRELCASFPKKINLKYGELACVENDRSPLLSNEQIENFHHIEAFTTLLFDLELIEADRYYDGKNNMFWNMKLSFPAYCAINEYFEQKGSSAAKSMEAVEHAVDRGRKYSKTNYPKTAA